MDYKFKMGNKVPPDDKIDKHKNFKKLKANYDQQVKPLYKRPLYKDPKAFIVVLIILLLTYLIAEVAQKEEGEGHETEQNDSEHSTPNPGPQPVGESRKDTIKYPSQTQADSVKKDNQNE